MLINNECSRDENYCSRRMGTSVHEMRITVHFFENTQPDTRAKNIEELKLHIHDYLSLTFDCLINDSECDFMRLLIAELNKFPQLFKLYYAKEETHTTSNLEAYLINYYKKHDPQKIKQSYLISCQIIDMLRGQTIWVKLIKNSKRGNFFKDKSNIVNNLTQSAILLINHKVNH